MSVSVYSGYDPTDEAADEILQEVPQPQPTQRDSPDGQNHQSNTNMEDGDCQPNNSMTIGNTGTQQEVSVSGSDTNSGTPQPAPSSLRGQLHTQCTQPIHHGEQFATTSSTAGEDGEHVPIDAQVTIVSPSEFTRGGATVSDSDGDLTVLPKVAVVHAATKGDSSRKSKKNRWCSSGANSDYVSSIDSMRLRTGEQPVVKFGNMLDHCYSEGSDAEIPKTTKPAIVKPTGVRSKSSSDWFDKRGDQSTAGTYIKLSHTPKKRTDTIKLISDPHICTCGLHHGSSNCSTFSL